MFTCFKLFQEEEDEKDNLKTDYFDDTLLTEFNKDIPLEEGPRLLRKDRIPRNKSNSYPRDFSENCFICSAPTSPTNLSIIDAESSPSEEAKNEEISFSHYSDKVTQNIPTQIIVSLASDLNKKLIKLSSEDSKHDTKGEVGKENDFKKMNKKIPLLFKSKLQTDENKESEIKGKKKCSKFLFEDFFAKKERQPNKSVSRSVEETQKIAYLFSPPRAKVKRAKSTFFNNIPQN